MPSPSESVGEDGAAQGGPPPIGASSVGRVSASSDASAWSWAVVPMAADCSSEGPGLDEVESWQAVRAIAATRTARIQARGRGSGIRIYVTIEDRQSDLWVMEAGQGR